MASNQITGLSVPYSTPAEIYVMSLVLPSLGIMFVLLRVYTRVIQTKTFGIDDWLILPALVMLIGMGIILIIGVHLHTVAYLTPYASNLTPMEKWTYTNPTISLMGKIQYACLPLLIMTSGFVKLSVTFFYRRIFAADNGEYFEWITRVVIFVLILWTTSFTIASIFGCGVNFSANWGSVRDEMTYCTATLDLDNALIVSGFITDMIILGLPLPVIWNLDMTTARRFTVIGILSIGSLSVAASIIKVIINSEITSLGPNTNVDPHRMYLLSLTQRNSTDQPPVTSSTILYWSLIESGLALIAACLPTFGFLVRNISLDRIVKSVRNALSMCSMRSRRSRQVASRREGPYSSIRAARSASSRTLVPETGTVHSWGEASRDTSIAMESGIYVSNRISQYETIV